MRLPLPQLWHRYCSRGGNPTVATERHAAARLDGLSILAVDEDPESCEALTKLLGYLGAEVAAENSA